ncbi:MAG: PspC domain-containing protein [Bacteroidales bacterium]|jgi:phage shock protein PspC (stress-responsive transcriptional regulator)|nr:PspC domain-containing protein [Bacteroidales bacterium]MCI2121184.1 PspC domain-containing protein [Bacteroidales bacterium]MCI2145028.1 PspC domain-containing protein [Bacteroidales bacterium]
MNKVEKVSIGNYAFTLEQEAFEKIKKYLDDLSTFYSSSQSGSEIMDGIEERMAELLLEKLGNDCIVTSGMADSVISVLGDPEQIENESSTDTNDANRKYYAPRRLYRNPGNKIIAGVCSGIGEYCHCDPIIFRLAFALSTVLLFAFLHLNGIWPWIPAILYILLWICVPEARTVRQRCEMRGEKGTVDEIKYKVENEGCHPEPKVHNTNNFWKVFWRIIAIIVGIIFFIIGISGIAALIVALFGLDIFKWISVGNMDPGFITGFYNTFPLMGNIPGLLFKIPLFIVLFMPFVALLYAGLQIIFRFRTPSWRPGLIMLILWGAALIMLIVVACIAAIPVL